MEETNQCCLSCLCTGDEFNLQEFAIQCEPLRPIFQVDKLSLCYVCTRLLQHTEMFVQNVQSNQILLQNLHGDMQSIQSVRPQIQLSIALTLAHLPSIELTGFGDEELSVFSSRDQGIKLEPKEEMEQLEGEFIDGSDDFQDSVKEENYLVANYSLKEEIELDSIDLKSLRRSLRNKKVKKKDNKKERERKMKKSMEIQYNCIRVHISEEQCIEERVVRAQDPAYLSSEYRCETCAQGFALKHSYHAHIARHSPSRGDFECSVCTLRFKTEAKLTAHKQGHTLRYKCPQCDLTCANYSTMTEHFADKHTNNGSEFRCPQCPKVFTRRVCLRKHKTYRHSGRGEVFCEHCHKTYANKDSLRIHIIRKHNLESTCSVGKRYCCKDCGLAFKAPSHLKNHAVKHTDLRPFYCVECDRSFKTAYALSHHLKTAAPHVNYAELPLHCQSCDKRFAVKRDLIRHMNRVHLNIKPYSCDKCDRAYINNWSLNEHKRYTHEGLKRPLRYPCSMCDKVFDRNSILKSHARTHTGERPYQCSRCPAAFGQSSALGTHVRLVHLKLTRAGRPKARSDT